MTTLTPAMVEAARSALETKAEKKARKGRQEFLAVAAFHGERLRQRLFKTTQKEMLLRQLCRQSQRKPLSPEEFHVAQILLDIEVDYGREPGSAYPRA